MNIIRKKNRAYPQSLYRASHIRYNFIDISEVVSKKVEVNQFAFWLGWEMKILWHPYKDTHLNLPGVRRGTPSSWTTLPVRRPGVVFLRLQRVKKESLFLLSALFTLSGLSISHSLLPTVVNCCFQSKRSSQPLKCRGFLNFRLGRSGQGQGRKLWDCLAHSFIQHIYLSTYYMLGVG